jgi:UDP-N-acetylmuramoylalanine--D-glutamate ligase
MILLPHMKGKALAVLGLGRTGLSVVRSLNASGARVLAWDDNEAARTRLEKETGVAATAPAQWHWDAISALVLSPGIPFTHPVPHELVVEAQAANVPVLSDVELFLVPLGEKGSRTAPVIAVTGTNGKSTTCALIHHILNRAGFNAQLGGNIGKPVLELDPPGLRSAYVLEMSSYQIDLTPSIAPEVGVLLNITPDHLERHGGLEGYAAAKRRLFDGQHPEDVAIAGVDDALSAEICADLKLRHREGKGAAVVPVAVGRALGRGAYVANGRLVDANADPAVEVADLTELPALRGAHNWQNAAAAYAAARSVGARPGEIADALASFPGLAHRQELAAKVGHVLFVNDSKATNADAAAKALLAYDNIYWIAGGEAKEGGLTSAMGALAQVRKAYLIGAAAAEFAKALEGKVETIVSKTLDVAVLQAAQDAAANSKDGAVVLLSPACASFDQFTDYEARGAAFCALAREVAHAAQSERVAP